MPILALKIGDQSIKGNENAGIKDGQIADIVSDDIVISDHTRKVFATFYISEELAEKLRPYTIPEFEEDGSTIKRKRPANFDLLELAKGLSDESLVEKWRGKDVVPSKNVKPLGDLETKIKDSKTTDYNTKELIPDTNALLGGVATYGSASDYATLALLEADLGTLTSKLTVRLNSNLTVANIGVTFNTDAASYDVDFDSSSPHGGDITAGYAYTADTGNSMIALSFTNPATVEFFGFTLKNLEAAGGDKALIRQSCNCVLKVHEMFGISPALAGKGAFIYHRRIAGSTAYNNVVYGGVVGFDFIFSSGTADIVLENNTVYNATYGIIPRNLAITMRSNALYCATAFLQLTGCTGLNNISSGTSGEDGDFGTGSGNIVNGIVATETVSQDPANVDFMKPVAGGQQASGGLTPITPATDMAGNAWDAVSPSRGAFQYKATLFAPIMPHLGIHSAMFGGGIIN